MRKYMYLFRGGDAARAATSPEEMQTHMDKWKTWMGNLAEKEQLIDGLPLSGEGKQVVGKDAVVHDGPYAESKEIVGGYLIVNAPTIEDAVIISKGCPIFEHNGKVEVREIMSM